MAAASTIRLGSLAITLAAGIAGGSCLPDPVFVCSDHDECAALGEDARCEAVQFCSIGDQNCTSGRRFHAYAGDGLAGLCTDVTCGDGELQGGELCDDANDIDADGCNNDCQPSGTQVWQVGYESPGAVRDRCYSVAADSLGNVTVVGHISSAIVVDGMETEQGDIWIRQYDGDGVDQWTWVLPGDNPDEEAWAVLPIENDDLLVAAAVGGPLDETDAWIGRFDHAGSLLWESRYGGLVGAMARIDVARDVTIAPDGDVVAIGYATNNSSRETDIWFRRMSPDGRTERWTQYRDGIPGALGQNQQDRAHGIAAVRGGYVGVGVKQYCADPMGCEDGEIGAVFWVERFKENGDMVWTDEGVVGEPSSVLTAVAAIGEDDVLLAGWRAQSQQGNADMWLQRRGPAGEILWDHEIASPGNDDDKANAIVVDDLGGFIIGGEMGTGSGSTDAWMGRFAANRSLVWDWTLSGGMGARDTTWGVDIAADGSVYACGYQSEAESIWDLWVARFTP